MGFVWAKRGWKCGPKKIEKNVRCDREATFRGTEGDLTQTLDDSVQGTKPGGGRAILTKIKVVTADRRNIIGEATFRLNLSFDY